MTSGSFYRPPGPVAARPASETERARRTFLLLGGALLAAAAAGGVLLVLRLHPRFVVTRVVLEGVPEARRTAAEEVTDRWIGEPLLFVDLASGLRSLGAQRWVASATARRLVPDTVVVTIAARPPVALVRVDGVLHAVDVSGTLLGPWSARSAPGDDLVVLDPAPAPGDARALARAAGFVARLAVEDPALYDRLSEVEVHPDGLAVVDRAARVRLLFGADAAEPGRAAGRWRAFLSLRPELERHSLARTEADLRFADRIILNALPPEAERGKT